tara:strand:- start:189 stop:569 length:381 start_codon:yes stop_codon:yes gene_type:complete
MDIVSKEKRSEMMSSIRSKNTRPEMKVRKYLFSKGYRFRLHVRELPGKPDIVLPKYKTAIQVRGCFWHGHGCRLSSFPKTNRKFWKNKILDNKKRDAKNDRKLRKMGYRLLIVNECNMEKIKKWNS